MKTITVKGGPLDGKRYVVPEDMDTFDGPEPDAGHYKVNEVTAAWQETAPAQKAAVTRARKANAADTTTPPADPPAPPA